MASADLTAIIVNYNTGGLLHEAIGRLRSAAAGLSLKVVIVDNASRDGSVELIKAGFPDCALIANETNRGFGRANNQALALAEGRYVLLLNTDAFVSPDTLSKTLEYMDAHPRFGILGVRLIGADGAALPSARFFPTPWNLFLSRTGLSRVFSGARLVDERVPDRAPVRPCDWVPGCFYLVRREVIDEVGLFDSRYFLYYEEVDHCLAAKRAGWLVACFTGTTVQHIGGESAKTESEITTSGRQIEALQVESELLFFRKNRGRAGVWSSLVLTLLADAIVAAKSLLKRDAATDFAACLKHAALVSSLFWRTRLGTRPTR